MHLSAHLDVGVGLVLAHVVHQQIQQSELVAEANKNVQAAWVERDLERMPSQTPILRAKKRATYAVRFLVEELDCLQ